MPPRSTKKTKETTAPSKKLSQLQELIAKQKATEKALAEAKAQLLVKRNLEMLDEEEEEIRPRKKKSKSSRAPSSDTFGEDDAEGLQGLLGSDRTVGDKEQLSEEGSDGEPGPTDDLEEEEDSVDGDDSLPVMPMQDADMITEEPAIRAKTAGHRHAAPKGKATGKTARVTQGAFSPESVRLANVGRFAVRVDIATKAGFPADHANFAWNAMSTAVASSESPALIERLAAAEESPERRDKLVNYAWGGAAQLRGEVKTLCKAAVALYGIPGNYTPTQIAAKVKWLTGKKGIFKFGGINLDAETYDLKQPFGAPFYPDVMTKQWYDSAKAEGVRASSFAAYVDSPVPIVTLVTDGMENSLKEWATGVRIQIKFTEEEFGPRYEHHRAVLLNLQKKSPTWFSQFQRNLYTKIVSTLNFPHLQRVIAPPEEDELDGVDFEALEASAIGDKTEAATTAEPAPAAVTAA